MKYSIIIPTIGRATLPAVLEGIMACDSFEAIKPEILVVFDGIRIFAAIAVAYLGTGLLFRFLKSI